MSAHESGTFGAGFLYRPNKGFQKRTFAGRVVVRRLERMNSRGRRLFSGM